jgi:hypothetical protein
MMIITEESVECELAGETEVLGENLPISLRPPQIPHDLTRIRTGATAVGSWLLATWTMARPYLSRYND